MVKQVPAVDKALRIIAELAATPSEPLTLSELARAADINLSTCHSIVMSLTDASYLLRHEPSKTYSLGPALVEVGTAALQQYPGLPMARAAAEQLCARFDLPVVVGGRAGDELLVLAHTSTTRLEPPTRQGFRGPMVPPLGLLFMAWASDADVDRWLSRLNLPSESLELGRHREMLAAIRERGYLVSLDATTTELTVRLAVQLAHATTQRERMKLSVEIADLLRKEEYAHLSQHGMLQRHDVIAAPVFGPDMQVALTISVTGRPGDFTAKTTPAIARAVLSAAKKVTTALGGHMPRREIA